MAAALLDLLHLLGLLLCLYLCWGAGLGRWLAGRTFLALAPRLGRRPPDVVIGRADDPYMLRWHVWRRNPWCNLYLHRFLRSDRDVMHDHPWWSLSWVLRGGYHDRSPGDGRRYSPYRTLSRPYAQGDLILRRAGSVHRVELAPEVFGDQVFTLFLTGPKVREWGFHCRLGWVPWFRFVKPGSPGEVEAGCGELA